MKAVRWLASIALAIVFFSAAGRTQTQSSPPVGLRIIVVNSAGEAQQILEQLKSGADFATLARQKSIDSTAGDGGSMGKVDPATLRVELRDGLSGVQAGQISGVIKISSGYAILKVESADSTAGPSSPPAAAPASGSNSMLPLAGRGNVKYSPNVAGAPEADVTFQAYPKPDGWEQDLQEICRIRKQALAENVQLLEKMLPPAGQKDASDANPMDTMQARYTLGQLQAYQGHMAEAIEQWQASYGVAESKMPQGLPQLQEALGTAYLHKSEMENDVYTAPGDRCIFPPAKASAYKKTADSEKAIAYFLKYLQQKPDELEVKWLLNLAYMTLGKYPDGVPAQYLIPPSVFESKENVGRFNDVAPAAGINLVSMAGGIIVDDFENNGLLDVVTSSYNVCEPMHYFHNNGDGTFTDRSAQAGLTDELGGLNIMQADYNNDGCMDILVTRGGWQWPMRMSLLRNNCNGTFTDVTREAGLSVPVATQTAVWADIDNDGWVDLFVGNERGPGASFSQ